MTELYITTLLEMQFIKDDLIFANFNKIWKTYNYFSRKYWFGGVSYC